jgi:hypothetical protein
MIPRGRARDLIVQEYEEHGVGALVVEEIHLRCITTHQGLSNGTKRLEQGLASWFKSTKHIVRGDLVV